MSFQSRKSDEPSPPSPPPGEYESLIKKKFEKIQRNFHSLQHELKRFEKRVISERILRALITAVSETSDELKDTDALFKQWQGEMSPHSSDRHKKRFSYDKLRIHFESQLSTYKSLQMKLDETAKNVILDSSKQGGSTRHNQSRQTSYPLCEGSAANQSLLDIEPVGLDSLDPVGFDSGMGDTTAGNSRSYSDDEDYYGSITSEGGRRSDDRGDHVSILMDRGGNYAMRMDNVVEEAMEDHPLLQAEEEMLQHEAVADRSRAIQRIHHQVHHVNQIFRDLRNFVSDQGTSLDAVETHIDGSLMNSEGAVDELRKAHSYQKSFRKRICWMAILALVVIATIVMSHWKS